MAKYLSHTEYNRWFRAYQLNLERYLAQIDALRLALGLAPDTPERIAIEGDFERIDELLEKTLPRNFNPIGDPLNGYEIFLENFKIISNYIFKLLHLNEPFQGIYQTEKERVLKLHQEYKFKDKFLALKAKVDALFLDAGKLAEEAKRAEESAAATEALSQKSKTEEENMGF